MESTAEQETNKMMPEKPIKIGGPRTLTRDTETDGKRILAQTFRNPKNGKKYDYTFFGSGHKFASIVMPLTVTREVVCILQYRHPPDDFIYELPGGTGESVNPEPIAEKELLEETGYRAGSTIRLTPRPIWFEPANSRGLYWPCISLNCVPSEEQKLDQVEYIEVVTMPLPDWIESIKKGTVRDSKSIATTFLAALFTGLPLK